MWSASLALAFAPVVLGADVQLAGLTVPSKYASSKNDVKQIFTDSYNAYRKFAFGHDEVEPISQTFTDPRNGWGASIVDGMDTMQIMGLNNFFNEAVNFSQKINFNVSNVDETVSVFESTIRYVGGLISTFELTGKKNHALIDRAVDLGNKLSVAWSAQNTVIPYGELNFTTDTAEIATTNIAEAGTLTLEFDRLSLYSGNDTYRRLALGSVEKIKSLPAPLPGFPAQGVDPGTNQPVGALVTWSGGSDSYLEYLIKYARLTNSNDDLVDAWLQAVDSSIHTLLRTSTVGNHLYLATLDDSGLIEHTGSHLACFYGGNWMLGARMTNNQTIFDLAVKLNEACWNTYAGDATGIGPEGFAFISNEKNGSFTGSGQPTQDQLTFYQKHGYYVTSSDYIQRPEVLESNFYAWRATGDTKYLDRAVSAVNSFEKFLKISNGGYTGLWDVNNVSGDDSNRVDDTESFWFAETLKYLYLTFDDPNHISLNDFVINTEAHPFAAPPAKPSYGTGGKLPHNPWQIVQAGPIPAVSQDIPVPIPPTVTATIGPNPTASV